MLQELGQRSLLLSHSLELSHGPECHEKSTVPSLIIIFKGHGNVLYSFLHAYPTDASNSKGSKLKCIFSCSPKPFLSYLV